MQLTALKEKLSHSRRTFLPGKAQRVKASGPLLSQTEATTRHTDQITIPEKAQAGQGLS